MQYPFADARRFLAADTGRLTIPNWPLAAPDRDFVRGFGSVRHRRRGGLADWAGEEIYCSAARALRFEPGLKRRRLGGPEAWVTPRCAFRRLLSSGEAVSRIEVGLAHAKRSLNPFDGPAFLALIQSCLDLHAKVPSPRGDLTARPLLECDRALARYYLHCTTRRQLPAAASPEPWWLTPGAPLLLIESPFREVSGLPPYAQGVEAIPDGHIQLDHCWVERNGRRVGIWFLRYDAVASQETLRRLRLHLFRFHAELEGLRQILRVTGQQRLTIQRGTEASDRLQAYLRYSLRLLSRTTHEGFPQSNLLTVAQQVTDVVSEGERTTLLEELKKIRKNILRSVEQFTASEVDRIAHINVLGSGNSIFVAHEQNLGGKTMTGYHINFGDHSVVSGNFIVASTITNSLNTIQNSDASVELKQRLIELSKAVAQMSERLPAEEAERAARALDTLTKEATSKTPDRQWYEVSAKGLVEAAKTVGELAAPVVSSVKSVLSLLGWSLPV